MLPNFPRLVYGTAWKKGNTASLVVEAIKSGFRAIDTAAHPTHYEEKLVGQGIREAIASGLVSRDAMFIQSKFSPGLRAEHAELPYDPASSISEQVRSSITTSLGNLADKDGQSYIDCILLHAPFPQLEDTLRAWHTMASFVPQRVRCLGISNADLATLKLLTEQAPIKPAIVQNRFYSGTAYDRDIRRYCSEHGLVYQAFWTLTANPHLLNCPPVLGLADAVDVQVEVALYALIAASPGTAILNGTSKVSRMLGDLAGIEKVSHWSNSNQDQWHALSESFENALGALDNAQT